MTLMVNVQGVFYGRVRTEKRRSILTRISGKVEFCSFVVKSRSVESFSSICWKLFVLFKKKNAQKGQMFNYVNAMKTRFEICFSFIKLEILLSALS